MGSPQSGNRASCFDRCVAGRRNLLRATSLFQRQMDSCRSMEHTGLKGKKIQSLGPGDSSVICWPCDPSMPSKLLSLSFHTCKTGISGLYRMKARRLLRSLVHCETLQQSPELCFSVTGDTRRVCNSVCPHIPSL